MADLVGWLQLLGAGSVGGVAGQVVAQYVSAGPERRKARADVRSAMTELDELVWHADDPEVWPRLRRALHAFESASMIAGVPRDLSNWYVTTRLAFYGQSRRNYERHGGPDEGGGWLERHHLQGLNEAAEMIYQALWHPQRSRWFRKRRLAAAKERTRKAVADSPELLRDLDRGDGPV